MPTHSLSLSFLHHSFTWRGVCIFMRVIMALKIFFYCLKINVALLCAAVGCAEINF